MKYCLPSMSKPIHIETLHFCRHMARQFREVESHHEDRGWLGTGLFADNGVSKEAGNVAMAYETIAKHIENQIACRELVKEMK